MSTRKNKQTVRAAVRKLARPKAAPKRNAANLTMRNVRPLQEKVSRLEDELEILRGRVERWEDVLAARLPAASDVGDPDAG